MSTLTADRRSFVVGGSALGLGVLASCSPTGEEAPVTSSRPYDGVLGVQLYTVRDLFKRDARATLEAIAEIDFKDCETAGLFDHDPKEIKTIMDDLGLMSRSGHIRLPQLREGLGSDIEAANILGQDKLYLGWIPEEERTLDKYREIADLLNERGAAAQSAGLTLGYHNHEFEFIDQDGENGYDILLERTDPDLVEMEIDFFWANLAKVDTSALFDKAPGRFTSCHIKDADADGNMVSVGDGVLDFAGLLADAEKAGLERFYVEHDNPEDPLASIARGFASLTA